MLTALSINTGGLGRFGNSCFTIAGVIGIARKSGQPYGFPEWVIKDNANFGQQVDNINEYLVQPLPPAAPVPYMNYGYFWGWRDINLPQGNWSIDAHMQSFRFFSHCIPEVRRVLTFKNEPPQNECVAIHYRGGDYTEGSEGHHPRCTKEYYEAAMRLFPVGTEFHLFTDSTEDAMKLFLPMSNDFIITIHTSPHYVEDFKHMKRCKSFITANSSFSLMAAILGEHPEKVIVCPRQWFGKSMPPEFGTEDIYPENTIII